jgi:site-specific recombinase XerD
MLEELRRRNFADTTIRSYLHGVAHFSRYFRRPPDQLGPEDIRKYQAMLFTRLKYSPNTVILRLASLRFFYIHVLKRGWSHPPWRCITTWPGRAVSGLHHHPETPPTRSAS